MGYERLSGNGKVFLKQSGEPVGQFDYQVDISKRPGSALWHADAAVDLDLMDAIRFQRDGAVLVLRVQDGRYLDFFVTGVSPSSGDVTVTATGGLYAME